MLSSEYMLYICKYQIKVFKLYLESPIPPSRTWIIIESPRTRQNRSARTCFEPLQHVHYTVHSGPTDPNFNPGQFCCTIFHIFKLFFNRTFSIFAIMTFSYLAKKLSAAKVLVEDITRPKQNEKHY